MWAEAPAAESARPATALTKRILLVCGGLFFVVFDACRAQVKGVCDAAFYRTRQKQVLYGIREARKRQLILDR